jgi:N-acetylglucosaminyl-diphospho-decaprenol L-rhamnosyltransferase
MLDLAVIILNYNTRDLLRESLRSVYANTGLAFAVCVVDNCSSDGSAEMVRAEFPQAAVVASPINGGYPYGNNLGLRYFGYGGQAGRLSSLPRYAMLLNPDTVVPDGALAGLMRFMDTHPDAGVVGPRLVLLDGHLDLACRRGFPTLATSIYHFVGLARAFPHNPRFARYNMTFLDEDCTAEVDSVVGAAMVVRREAIEQSGLMDEAFFMYGEDLDWAKRIKEHGWTVYYHPDVIIHHVKRAASRYSRKAQVEFYRAMLIFYRKHYRASTPFWLDWLVTPGVGLVALLRGGPGLARDVLRPAGERPAP